MRESLSLSLSLLVRVWLAGCPCSRINTSINTKSSLTDLQNPGRRVPAHAAHPCLGRFERPASPIPAAAAIEGRAAVLALCVCIIYLNRHIL